MTASISFKKSHRQVSGNKKTLPVSRPVQALNRNHPKAHMVFWQYRGSSSFVLKEGKFRTYAQQALWLPARFDHDVYVDADAVLLRFFFDAEQLFTPSVLRESRIFQVNQELTEHFMGMVQSDTSLLQYRRESDQYVLDKLSKLCSTLMWPHTPAARKVAEILNDNPGDPRTLHELAEFVHASPRTIERAFVTETGETFQEWRMETRTAKAKQLILNGFPIDSIALHVGYSTASAFGRAFKKRTGFSPSSYFNEHVDSDGQI